MTNKRIVLILIVFLVVSTVASPLLSLIQQSAGPDPEVLRLPTFATAVGAAVEGTVWSPLDTSTLPTSLACMLVLQLLGAAGEKLGWRGVAQPLLEIRFSVVWSGVVTGLFFGLGHFYVVLAASPFVYLTFVISAIGLSVTLAVLTAGRSLTARIVIATLFHWLVNSAMLVFFSGRDESFAVDRQYGRRHRTGRDRSRHPPGEWQATGEC